MSPPVLSDITFKDAVRTYIEMHDEIMASSKKFRELRKKKDELGEGILHFMKHNGIDEFQLADGKLMRKAAKRTEGLKKEYILNSLKAVLQSDEKAEACVAQMMSHRAVSEKELLRRTRQGKTTARDGVAEKLLTTAADEGMVE